MYIAITQRANGHYAEVGRIESTIETLILVVQQPVKGGKHECNLQQSRNRQNQRSQRVGGVSADEGRDRTYHQQIK